MPIYEYRCRKCAEEFEKLVFNDAEEVACPQCKGVQVNKLMSVCAFSVGSNFRSTASSACGSCTPSPTGCSACGVKH